MNFIRTLLSFALMAVFSLNTQAQVRKYSNEFLAIGVGARALGMSGAQVALTNDLTSGYWNPAGLLGITSNFQVGFMHAEYFAGIAKYDYGAFAKPIDNTSAFGISVIRFGIDDIPNTIDLVDANGNINYNRISTFSAADYAFIFSYAKKLPIEGLTLGGNAKIIYRQVGSFARAFGFGLDAGVQYQRGNWKLGGVLRDVTTTVNSWSYSLDARTIEVFNLTGNEIPKNGLEITLPRMILGTARDFKFTKKFAVTFASDLLFTFDGQRNTVISSKIASIEPAFGLEFNYANLIYLRGGLGNFQKEKAEIGNYKVTTFQPNFGVGIKFKGISIDYALTDIGDLSTALYSNIFSLKLDLSRSE